MSSLEINSFNTWEKTLLGALYYYSSALISQTSIQYLIPWSIIFQISLQHLSTFNVNFISTNKMNKSLTLNKANFLHANTYVTFYEPFITNHYCYADLYESKFKTIYMFNSQFRRCTLISQCSAEISVNRTKLTCWDGTPIYLPSWGLIWDPV